jgi:ABC-type Na+ transport system ATPase subunit NatA
MGPYRAYLLVNTKKLACLRKRLAIEADAAILAALTHLLEKETERSAVAIQKEMDRQEIATRRFGRR